MLYYDTPKLRARFDAKADRSRQDGCWPWFKSFYGNGYGRFYVQPATRGAHRVAWELASGEPIPSGLLVLHTCDHRPCVRNDDPGVYFVNGIYRPRFGHLFIGTYADNRSDMLAKGRDNTPSGERHVKAKVTDAGILEMCRLYLDGWTQASIAERFTMSTREVSQILLGKVRKGAPRLAIQRQPGRKPRKSACRHGHPLTGENLSWAKEGYQICVTCRRMTHRAYYLRKMADRKLHHGKGIST